MPDLLTDSSQVELSYTLRYSRKAKYLQIRISSRGLEVVVPQKKPPKEGVIKEFINKKKSWIEKHLKNQINDCLPKQDGELPTQIHLHALHEVWDIFYIATQSSRIKLMTNRDKQIKLMGCVHDRARCLRILCHWLKNIATTYLTTELTALAKMTGLEFQRVFIRNNISRWGSCSSKGHINLCCKLMLLPNHLMRHVLIHELCHTKFMNHGPSFWALLLKHDPLAKTHARELKEVRKYIPNWINENF